jgi:hypothetical protein
VLSTVAEHIRLRYLSLMTLFRSIDGAPLCRTLEEEERQVDGLKQDAWTLENNATSSYFVQTALAPLVP